MGRKKLDTMDYISNENLRNIAYSKRRKGLVKKAMELSKLCGVKVQLVLFDQKKLRLTHFNSEDEFSLKVAQEMIDRQIVSNNLNKFEKFTNADYERLSLVQTSLSAPPIVSSKSKQPVNRPKEKQDQSQMIVDYQEEQLDD